MTWRRSLTADGGGVALALPTPGGGAAFASTGPGGGDMPAGGGMWLCTQPSTGQSLSACLPGVGNDKQANPGCEDVF